MPMPLYLDELAQPCEPKRMFFFVWRIVLGDFKGTCEG